MTDERLARATRAFDQLNADDPTFESCDGTPTPRELAKAVWLTRWLDRLDPSPSDALRLASHCQHLMRWKVKRSEFPDGRAGYHAWRRHMASFHADQAEKVLRQVGYDDATIGAVRRIVLKQGMSSHADVQTMEDALCLAFIEDDLEQFARGRDEARLLEILRDTWNKMSPHGRSFAPGLAAGLSEPLRALIERAIKEA